jgi:Leucine-rich repeat (LRR) protein
LYIGSVVGGNPFDEFPALLRKMKQLEWLSAGNCDFVFLPDWIDELKNLRILNLEGNQIRELPSTVANLNELIILELKSNPLGPELAAAVEGGLDSVKRYLRAQAGAQVVLNDRGIIGRPLW